LFDSGFQNLKGVAMKKLSISTMFVVLLLLLIQPVSAALVQLTTDAANERTPSWSPDGQYIVFSMDTENDGSDLYIISARGGAPQQLTSEHCDMYPSWSPDGTTIVFSRATTTDINRAALFTIPASGGEVTQLTDGSQVSWQPDWSSDGSTIVFMEFSDLAYHISTIPAAGGTPTRLSDLEVSCWSPKFCERDNRIAFSAQYPGVDDNIFVMNADGSGIKQLTTKAAAEVQPDWAPNGTMIVYSDRSGADNDLYLIPGNGSGPGKQFTNFQADERNPVWSHDGTKLAFESDRSGNCDIWILDNVWLKIEPTTVGMIKAAYQ
jgi:TolB protein